MQKGAIVLALVSVALLDCATLSPLGEGICGNGVIDTNEDCDGFKFRDASATCGAPSDRERACRLTCAKAERCPDGWGCATDGICREPSGRFAPISEGMSAGVETMVVGDFDGDRRKDVLGSGPQSATGTAKVRVHYFDAKGQLAHVNALSAPISSPSVRDLDKDLVDDFAFGLDIGGLGVITGQKDRSLIPAVFPSFRISRIDAKAVSIRAVSRLLPGPTKAGFLFAGTVTNPITKETANRLASPDGGYSHSLPVGVEGLIGEPVWGTFLVDATSTCGEVAVAMKSGQNGMIQVFAPCRPKIGEPAHSDWASLRPPIVIDPGMPIDGIQVIDEKVDGRSDLLFSTTRDGNRRVYLLRSNGSGFDPPLQTALVALPLASGDLDLDNKVDFVLPGFILLSTPRDFGPPPPDAGTDAGADPGETPFYYDRFVLSERRVRWTSARVGFFNGDAFPDVVAASDEQPDLDFFGAVGRGEFVQSTISTSGAVLRIDVGDLDGDQLVDVAFLQKPAGSGTSFDVAVAYARTNGAPEAPRVVGRTEQASAFAVFGDPGDPAIDSIGLFFRKNATDGGLPDLAIAIILGNGDRQPVAPLLLEERVDTGDTAEERQWAPLEVHAASVNQEGRIDLTALSVGFTRAQQQSQGDEVFDSAVWVAKGTGDRAFDAPNNELDREAGFRVYANRPLLFETRTAVGDIDRDPTDTREEVVVLERSDENDVVSLFIAPRLTLGPPQRPEVLATFPGERLRREAPFALADVDGDGSLDVVVLLGTLASAKLVVIYNNGSRHFSNDDVATMPMADGELPRGFALLTTGGTSLGGMRKAKRELAVVTNKRLLLAAPDPAERTRFLVRDLVTEGPAIGSATAIACGDFDGDGVDDLAIADSGALRILRQLPVRP